VENDQSITHSDLSMTTGICYSLYLPPATFHQSDLSMTMGIGYILHLLPGTFHQSDFLIMAGTGDTLFLRSTARFIGSHLKSKT
jgi:hypothetical protein